MQEHTKTTPHNNKNKQTKNNSKLEVAITQKPEHSVQRLYVQLQMQTPKNKEQGKRCCQEVKQ